MPSFPRLSLRFLAPFALAFTVGLAGAEAKSARRQTDDAPAQEKTHTVGPGQTLAKIAKRYHVSVADLREVNDLAAGQKLHSGMRLVIPSKDAVAKDKDRERDAEVDRDDDSAGSRKKGGKKKGKNAHASRDDEDDDRDAERERTADDDDDRDGKRGKGKQRETGKHGRHTGGVVDSGHLRLVHGGTVWEGKVFDKKGKLAPRALDGFSRVLASSGGKQHKMEPRLLSLVALVSDHFGGRTIEVVSGFRPKTTTQFTEHSRHNQGAAIDMHVRGVDNGELRDFCKTLRNVGVGFYPNSSFIHLDVRDAAATWVDFSKPGEAPRYNRPDAAKDAEDEVTEASNAEPSAAPKDAPASLTTKTDGSKATPETPAAKD